MNDRYVVSRVELGGLIDAVWEDIGYTAPTRQRNDAILDVWLSIKPHAPAADINGRLARIEAMLAKLTQAPALIPATRANIVKALRDAGYTNLAAMANTMTDKELGIDPHTDDAETERALRSIKARRELDSAAIDSHERRIEIQRENHNALARGVNDRLKELSKRIDAEQHANATLIAELRERVEKLEASETEARAIVNQAIKQATEQAGGWTSKD